MSLLNLNSPAGRGQRGKNSSRAWMGFGLVIAVLGIGSTFASNITLNSPEGNTEFGQGVTQTVYCGGDKSVTITPLSSYQNTVVGSGTAGISAVTFSARVVNSSGSNEYNASTSARTTINDDDSESVPRWQSRSEKKGWWLSSPTSTSIINPQPTLTQVAANPTNYYFAEESDTGEFKKGYNSSSYSNFVIITSNAVAPVPGATTPASFNMGGVLISDIPPECEGVNFVISSFAETGSAQTLISSGSDVVKEVAVYWTGTSNSSAISSKDRTALVTTSLISATQSTDSLKVVFDSASGSALSASDLYKIVVETQEDVIS
jgi:hypothetical protein